MFRKGHAGTDFLANESAFGALVDFTMTTLLVQLRDLVRADREGRFFTHPVGKSLFTKKNSSR